MNNDQTISELSGMTVNERLFHKGLTEEFDRAVQHNDASSMRRILEQLELGEENIDAVIEQALPTKQSLEGDRTP